MTQNPPPILILGLGNILLSDEGFGIHVIQELEKNYLFPPNIVLYDGGTGGLSLLTQFKDKDWILIVDALLLGSEPGTIARFTLDAVPENYRRKDTAHGIDILDVVAAASLTRELPPITVLGAQPKDMTTPGLTLTRELEEAKGRVIDEIITLLEERGFPVKAHPSAP